MELHILSYPENFPGEIELISALFQAGMGNFHLRKPNFQESELREFMTRIPEEFHHKIIVHGFPKIAEEFCAKGVHFKSSNVNLVNEMKSNLMIKGYSAHRLNEINEFGARFDYYFISPVFKSISKPDYQGELIESDMRKFLRTSKMYDRLVALGGIDDTTILKAREIGFRKFAVLGYLWNKMDQSGAASEMETSVLAKFKGLKHSIEQIRSGLDF